ncbi:MAG: hypothetical protein ACR2GO_05315 [Candidatus Limnocylindria bacterium]
MSATSQRYRVPDHLGYGWLDRHSVQLSDRLVVDYVNGEDLVYRVTAEDDRHWGVEEFYRLQAVASAEGPTLVHAAANLAYAQQGALELPPSWRRLADRIVAREDPDTRISLVHRPWTPAIVHPTLFDTTVVCAWQSGPAPDLLPKSFKVWRGQPPRHAGWHFMKRKGWYIDSSGPEVTISQCVIGTYPAPIINVEPVLDALISSVEGSEPPTRVIITTMPDDVAVDVDAGDCIVLNNVERAEAIRVAEHALFPGRHTVGTNA